MMEELINRWMLTTPGDVSMVIISSIVIYTTIIIYTRIFGLRTFSKMSAADFAMTVAVGSLFASTISSPQPALLLGMVALGCLHAGQWIFAILRKQSQIFSRIVDNEPLLLMSGSHILEKNLKQANVTRSDLFAKLREANVLNYDQVLAVVFETTGDISVLHSNQPDQTLESDFFESVLDSQLLFEGSK
ncbi:YetF domain-containing protein [uncultured Rubinisphaera sp.]|uniref:DUF421 domain-containing protein n=1 Tax=uncultured Rubinisphaera sp. TaxID=1678686 RepID=UPI0030DAEC0B|tara:strand:- start:287 stop:853 length:567 start_codon:yes stop_codon:yes gene_type:complete